MSLDQWKELHEMIREIHLSRNKKEMMLNWKKFEKRYKQDKPGDDNLFTYLESWMQPPFNKWMSYYNPPGQACTNSNIESFNATIKRDFFHRKRLSVAGAVIKFEQIIKYYQTIIFNDKPKYIESLNKAANEKVLGDYKSKGSGLYQIDEKLTINIKKKNCENVSFG